MNTRAFVLAAGQGTRLRPLTDDRPKCLVPLHGRPLLDWNLDVLRPLLGEPVILGGYREEQLTQKGLDVVPNADYESTNMVYSLFCAEDRFTESIVVVYGDIVFDASVVQALLDCTAEAAVVVDLDWRPYWEQRFQSPLDDAETLVMSEEQITEIGGKPTSFEAIQGQYIGLTKLGGSALQTAREHVAKLRREGLPWEKIYFTDLLQSLIDSGQSIVPVPIHGNWVEIDSPHDLEVAERLTDERENRLIFLDRSPSED